MLNISNDVATSMVLDCTLPQQSARGHAGFRLIRFFMATHELIKQTSESGSIPCMLKLKRNILALLVPLVVPRFLQPSSMSPFIIQQRVVLENCPGLG